MNDKEGNKTIKNSAKEIKQKDAHKLMWMLSGSYTIEAAYIMPLLLIVIFVIMYYVFFLHGSIISDVWAAHLAEEERMAVSYGRIPFDSGIYLDGFNDETGFIYAELLMSEKLKSSSKFMIAGKAEEAKLFFSDEEVSAEIDFSLNGLKLYSNGGVGFEESFSESRGIYYPQKYARITTGVYRFAKQSLFK